MRKTIALVAFFHLLCFASLIFAQLTKNQQIMSTAFYADMIGALICPIVLAVVAGITAISGKFSALKLYPGAASVIGGIGLGRGILFVFAMRATPFAGFSGAMRYLLFSFILLTVWFIIFELTRFMFSRGTKYNRPRKKS